MKINNFLINFKKLITGNWLLVLILTIAAFLRLWQLGSVPPSLTPDEASLGYNAYSILKTGKDEYGQSLPIIFKSFGDYKPGLYVYLTVPFVAVFGLNEWSTRLPSALAGIVAVILIYLIAKSLFRNHGSLGLAAAFVAATNPWLIYFSRGAWEANVSLLLVLAGVYFFLRSFENQKLIILSLIFFSSTLLTYQGAKLSTVMVVALLLVVYWNEIRQLNKKYVVYGLILGGIIALPIVSTIFNGQAGRLSVFSIFSYHRPPEEIQKYSDSYYYLFHSEPLNYLRAITGRWFNVFSGKFLFFEGDTENPIHTAPYQGVLLLADLFFLPLGFYFFFKNKLQKEYVFVFLWLLFAPLSAAISRDTTSAVRSLNTAIPFILISSFGLVYFLKKFRYVGFVIATIFYILAITYFADAYFVHVPAHNSNFWRYGYKEAVQYVVQNQSKYERIVFEQSFNQPYIYFLFYNPKIGTTVLEKSLNIKDVGLVQSLDNIEFKQIDWQVLKNEHGALIVASPISLPPDFSKDADLLKEIKYLNDRDVAFDIIKIK